MNWDENKIEILIKDIIGPLENTAVFIDSYSPHFIGKLAEVKSKGNYNFPVIVFDEDCLESLKEHGIEARHIEEFMDLADYRGIDADAFSVSQDWHKDRGVDMTEYDGISYGAIVQWEMCYFMAEILKCYVEIEKYLKVERPGKIVLIRKPPKRGQRILLNSDEDFHYRSLRKIANRLNIGFHEYYCSDIKDKTFLNNFRLNNIYEFTAGMGRSFVVFCRQLLAFFGAVKLRRRLKIGVLIAGANYLGQDLIRKLASDGNKLIVCISDALMFPELKINEFSCAVSLREHKAKEPGNEFVSHINDAFKRMLEKRAENLARDITYEDIFDRIEYLFKYKFINLYLEVKAIEKIFEIYKIKFILAPYDTIEREKAIVLVAAKNDIKSLVVLHGLIGQHNDAAPVAFRPLSADKMAILGDESYQRLIKMGIPEWKLVKTGCPRFDKYLRHKNAGPKSRNEREYIVVAGTGYFRESRFPNVHLNFRELRDFYFTIYETAKELGEYDFIVKCRDQEDCKYVNKLLSKKSSLFNLRVICNTDLEELLRNSFLLITNWSSVAAEAMLLGKLVVSVKTPNRNSLVSYDREGVVLSVNNARELIAAINLMKNDASIVSQLAVKREEYLKKEFVKVDSYASDRVKELIDNMLNGAIL